MLSCFKKKTKKRKSFEQDRHIFSLGSDRGKVVPSQGGGHLCFVWMSATCPAVLAAGLKLAPPPGPQSCSRAFVLRRWLGSCSCAHFSLSRGHTWLQGRWGVQTARWPPSQREPRRHYCQEGEKNNRDWGYLSSSVFLPCCPSCWDVTSIVWSFFWPPQADLFTASVSLRSSLSTPMQHCPNLLQSPVFTVSLSLPTRNILRREILPYSSLSTPQSLATIGHQQVLMRDNESFKLTWETSSYGAILQSFKW